MKASRTEEIELIERLKCKIRLLVKAGVSYAEIAEFASSGTDENAIKQFVHRDSKRPRMTPLARSLLDSYEDITLKYKQRINRSGIDFSPFSKMSELLNQTEHLEISEKISRKFKQIRDDLKENYISSKYLFIRKRVDGTTVYINIDIYKQASKLFFTMKAIGRHRKRLIIGDVSETLRNYYFSGLSYPVSEFLSNEEYLKIDYFKGKKLKKFVADSPIGIEYITFTKVQVEYVIFPVSFLGLDGDGNPLIGKGLMVNLEGLDAEEIEDIKQENKHSEVYQHILRKTEEYKVCSSGWKE